MRWIPGGRSKDLEDRRGGGSGPAVPGLRLGLGGLVLLVALSVLTGQNFLALLDPSLVGDGGPVQSEPYHPSPEEEKLVEFVSFVLDDAQATFEKLLPGIGHTYRRAKLVLFNDRVESACGYAQAAMGPFYCPSDEKVYIDLAFYKELRQRFGAPGDFAQAYVIAHEIGHHVQNILGTLPKIQENIRKNPNKWGRYSSIRLELQADCLAGVWGHTTARRDILEQGDAEEALNAAAAIGDDRVQKQTTGSVSPESWTHGSSKQRVAWFREGFTKGRLQECATFSDELPEDLGQDP
jgi:hypothetical protein